MRWFLVVFESEEKLCSDFLLFRNYVLFKKRLYYLKRPSGWQKTRKKSVMQWFLVVFDSGIILCSDFLLFWNLNILYLSDRDFAREFAFFAQSTFSLKKLEFEIYFRIWIWNFHFLENWSGYFGVARVSSRRQWQIEKRWEEGEGGSHC